MLVCIRKGAISKGSKSKIKQKTTLIGKTPVTVKSIGLYTVFPVV